MTQKVFHRIFVDNTKYADYKLLYIDALAYSVQKHLYKKNPICYLGGIITLYDFMSFTSYFISASMSEYGQSDIKTYISAMNNPSAQLCSGEAVEYINNQKYIVMNGTPAMIISVMWAAWVYGRFRLEIADEDKGKWQRAVEQLYDAMKDFYDSSEDQSFEEDENDLSSTAENAMVTMGKYIVEHTKKRKSNQPKSSAHVNKQSAPVPDKNTTQLQQQLTEAKRIINEQNAKIQRLNEELAVELVKENEKLLYNKVSFEFFLRLLESAGFDINNTGNKTRVGQLWHMITGKSADDLRKFCSDRYQYDNNHTKEDIKRLNKHLGDMGISTIEL